ncbi:MAG: hypothetical protein WBP13_02510 [Methylophilaceae bacterium]
MPSTHIYASKKDWQQIAQHLYDEYCFYQTDHTQSPVAKMLSFEVVNSGTSRMASQILGDSYLLVKKQQLILPRQINATRYAWDLMLNPHAISISLGGSYENGWIAGTIGYKLKNAEAKNTYQAWAFAIRKVCKLKIAPYYLGGECAHLFKEGKRRFTADMNSPSDYDLKNTL